VFCVWFTKDLCKLAHVPMFAPRSKARNRWES
jgi:hypothetical protein